MLRLCRWYLPITEDEKAWVLLQLKQQLLLPQIEMDGPAQGPARFATLQGNDNSRVLQLPRPPFSSSLRSSRAVYRQYGSLYCVAAINEEEIPLVIGELIDIWAGLLNQLLGGLGGPGGTLVEAQVAAHMETALLLLDSMLQHGYLVCSDPVLLLARTRDLMKQD